MDEEWCFREGVRSGAKVVIVQLYATPVLEHTEKGQKHRVGGPAVMYAIIFRVWYESDKRHREVSYDTRYWFENNKVHRVGGPALVCGNGDRKWYKNGELHRVGGPALECADGTRKWYENGELHRVGGPAIVRANGDEEWWKNGKRFR